MAGDIRAKERAIVSLVTSGSSLTSGTAVAAATNFDARSSGNAPDDFVAQFELVCQWATITGIVAGTIAAELYLLPILDGTNAPTVDTTSGTSRLPVASYAGAFECTKAPTANTNMRFISPIVQFNPLLYTPYVLNRSGQTISSAWTLKAVSVQAQYT
jgi:hypothetical protein